MRTNFRLALIAVAIMTVRTESQENSQSDSPDQLCSCVWYTSSRCECNSETRCDCSMCAKNGSCEDCLKELKTKTGVISGTLKSPYAKLAEGVVYVVDAPNRKFALLRKNPVMDQKDLTFIPHVLPIMAGTTVDFTNGDKVKHNVRSDPKAPKVFNLGEYEPKSSKSVTFDKECVELIGCNIHVEMFAYIIVCQNPYFAVTNKKGEFKIRNVPPGKYRITFFHEKLEPKEMEVAVEAGTETSAVFTDLKKK